MYHQNKNYKFMSQNYYCYVRDASGTCLEDYTTDNRLCFLNSSDFPKLIDNGYSIEVFAIFDVPVNRSYLSRCLRLSHRITNFIIKYNKLPQQTLL